MEIRSRDAAVPFTTDDGSTIRSLLDLSNAPVANHSLAEATIEAGESTVRHHHRVSEEIYYIVEGSGVMEIDGDEMEVTAERQQCRSAVLRLPVNVNVAVDRQGRLMPLPPGVRLGSLELRNVDACCAADCARNPWLAQPISHGASTSKHVALASTDL